MAFRKIKIMLGIPEDVYYAIPLAKKIAFRDGVRKLKSYAMIMNKGLANEEATMTATIHK